MINHDDIRPPKSPVKFWCLMLVWVFVCCVQWVPSGVKNPFAAFGSGVEPLFARKWKAQHKTSWNHHGTFCWIFGEETTQKAHADHRPVHPPQWSPLAAWFTFRTPMAFLYIGILYLTAASNPFPFSQCSKSNDAWMVPRPSFWCDCFHHRGSKPPPTLSTLQSSVPSPQKTHVANWPHTGLSPMCGTSQHVAPGNPITSNNQI